MWAECPGREDALKEEMATHSSILAWRIPWTAEPGGLPSVGSPRVGHNCSNSARTRSIHSAPVCGKVSQCVYIHTHTIRFQILFHYSFLHGIERYPVLYRLFMYLIHVRAR